MTAPISNQNDDDWAERYPPQWLAVLQPAAMASTGGLCSYPGCECPAVHVHHVTYFYADNPNIGVGTRYFPLCYDHHLKRSRPDCAHNRLNWYPGSGKPPKLDACQRPHYYKKLRAGWLEKNSRLKQ